MLSSSVHAVHVLGYKSKSESDACLPSPTKGNRVIFLDSYERNKSYRTHGTVENKIESFSSRLSIFYYSMSSDCDLYHSTSFKKLKAEPFISVSLCLLLFAFDAWYKIVMLLIHAISNAYHLKIVSITFLWPSLTIYFRTLSGGRAPRCSAPSWTQSSSWRSAFPSPSRASSGSTIPRTSTTLRNVIRWCSFYRVITKGDGIWNLMISLIFVCQESTARGVRSFARFRR